mmetsp:Transcript_26357/g.58566  ORF Transcript_26357/g.58566 Transcript_26357/m.58566 type:complete len:130 (+) Transcript_26357:366-755(+)
MHMREGSTDEQHISHWAVVCVIPFVVWLDFVLQFYAGKCANVPFSTFTFSTADRNLILTYSLASFSRRLSPSPTKQNSCNLLILKSINKKTQAKDEVRKDSTRLGHPGMEILLCRLQGDEEGAQDFRRR